ncbi:TetR/AcrR family transcriptional regulator [Actinomadura sp. B10D3]|uniref:TetR/AcrR family transcriptional regulator n=1 Tax=Actinomadura sp. B10D3 TaxID=3153557 RepID=UPI00325DD9B5
MINATAGQDPDPRIARTRDRVLPATVELLAERGVGGTTMEAIAHRSGVAKSTIYRHWPGLPPLIIEAFTSLNQAAPDRPSTGELRQDLTLYLGELARVITESPWAPLMTALVDGAERDESLRELLGALIKRRRARLEEIITAGLDRGELPGDTDPEFLAGVMGGALFYRRLISHESIDEAYVQRLVDTFVRMT